MTVEYFERRSAQEKLERVARPRSGAWAHMRSRALDVDGISEQFSLDANIVCDVNDIKELPRAEFKNGAEYVFIRLPIGDADAAETAPLLAILTAAQYITITAHAEFSPLQTDVFLTTSTDKPTSLLTATFASTISMYEQDVHALAGKISEARKRLSKHDVKNADFIEFVAIEDSLNEYRSSLEGTASVVKQLRENRHGLFRPRDLEALEDIDLHIQQLLMLIKSSAQTIASIQNAYSTIANNVLNQRMKALTAITILLAIPNVFYGMYGMNVALPFQHQWWAFPVIVGFTVLLILLLHSLAKRSRLL
jgi:magnesium transporter